MGDAMMLGKLLASGRPTTLDNSRARAYCAYSRCGWGLFGHFFSRLSFLHCRETRSVVPTIWPGRVAQSVGHLTRKSGVLGSIPDLATYFRFSCFLKKDSCQLLAKVCARSTG